MPGLRTILVPFNNTQPNAAAVDDGAVERRETGRQGTAFVPCGDDLDGGEVVAEEGGQHGRQGRARHPVPLLPAHRHP